MRKFCGYLKSRRVLLLLFAATCAIFLSIAALTGLSVPVVLYALLLTGFVLLVLLVAGWMRYARKLAALARFDGEAEERLPQPDDAVEAAYQRLLRERGDALRHCKNGQLASRADALDYYTLWVHQIKTPIAALQLLLDGENASAAARELFKIEQYTDLALRYVKLADLSTDLVVGPCALAPLVRACVRKYASLFIAKKLSVKIDALPETVVSDARWLAFILEQIISNSVKYTAFGGVHIHFTDGALAVDDTGIGIRPEDLPRVFEKGFTGVNGRLDMRASGIGLYLAKKAAAALAIELSVSSAVGKGTRVLLKFPSPDAFDRV